MDATVIELLEMKSVNKYERKKIFTGLFYIIISITDH